MRYYATFSRGTIAQSYRAPSWSWAATEGEIYYAIVQAPKRKLAIVENAHITLASSDSPFGEVREGWVHLRVILLRPHKRYDLAGEYGLNRMLEFCEDE